MLLDEWPNTGNRKRIFMFRGKARKFRRNGADKIYKNERYTDIKSQLINVQ
jgi:hypothetical protein